MRRIIMISGRQGAGKTTLACDLAEILRNNSYKPILLKFASPLYALHNLIYGKLSEYGVRPKKIDGTLMQLLGAHLRDTHDDKLWVKIVRHDIEKALKEPRAVVVIDDLRYKNEAKTWLRHEMCLVRLECPERVRKKRAEKWRKDTEHASETELDFQKFWDLTFDTSDPYEQYENAGKVFHWLTSKRNF